MSVANLDIGVRASTDGLKPGLDEARGHLDGFKRSAEEAGGGLRALGGHGELSGRLIVHGMREATQGISLMAGETRGATSAFADLMSSGLHGLLHGGAIGLGIGLVGAGIKAIGEYAAEARKETEELHKKSRKFLDDTKKQTEEVIAELQKVRDELTATQETRAGHPMSARDVALGRDVGAMEQKLKEDRVWLMRVKEEIADAERELADAKNKQTPGMFGRLQDQQDVMMAEGVLSQLRDRAKTATEEIAALEEKVTKEKALQVALAAKHASDADTTVKDTKAWWAEMLKALEVQEKIDASVEAMLGRYREQKDLAEALTQTQRDEIVATKAMDDAIAIGADNIQAMQVFEAALAAEQAKHAKENIDLANKTQEAWQKAQEAAAKAAAERAKTTNESLDFEIASLYAVTAEEKKQLDLARKIAQLRNDHADEGKIAALEAATAWRATFDEAQRAQKDLARDFQTFTGTVESGLTDALVNAATEGGRQFSDILKNTALQLERELASSLVHIAGQALMSLFGGGSSSGGIGGIVSAGLGLFTGGGDAGGGGNPFAGAAASHDFGGLAAAPC